ncbi:MAG TPA: DUF1062 domain-containing protein, partial [Roseiarcus sp.]|nr:DUF1062 domain-containing protein [Roseiarcus sp.]
DCESTWNRPIFERHHVKDIDPAALHSLQSNDMELVRSIAFDAQSLRRKSTRVEEFVDVDVREEILIEGSEPWSALEILLSVTTPTSLRLDRLLSTELDVSRGYISRLARDGRLRVTPERGHELRRSVADRTKITSRRRFGARAHRLPFSMIVEQHFKTSAPSVIASKAKPSRLGLRIRGLGGAQ